MTKKDYELFAYEINKIGKVKGVMTINDVIELLGGIFKRDNPLFQYDKFQRACLEGKHIRTSIKEG